MGGPHAWPLHSCVYLEAVLGPKESPAHRWLPRTAGPHRQEPEAGPRPPAALLGRRHSLRFRTFQTHCHGPLQAPEPQTHGRGLWLSLRVPQSPHIIAVFALAAQFAQDSRATHAESYAGSFGPARWSLTRWRHAARPWVEGALSGGRGHTTVLCCDFLYRTSRFCQLG